MLDSPYIETVEFRSKGKGTYLHLHQGGEKILQKYFGLKKYGKRFKQTIVSLLAFLLVFSGIAPSTVLQAVHAETASSTNTAVTQAKNKMLTYKFDNFSSDAVSQS